MNSQKESASDFPQPPSGVGCASLQAVILSAGEAKRAGGINKSFIQVKGRAILEHQIERMRPVFGERIAVVTNREGDYAASGIVVFRDLGLEPDDARKSSLHGLVSILHHFPDRWCFTMPCDMPYPDMDILRREVDYLRGVIARSSEVVRGMCLRDDKHLRPYHGLIHGSLGHDARADFDAAQREGREISTRDWLESRKDVVSPHYQDMGVSAEQFEKCLKNFNKTPKEK